MRVSIWIGTLLLGVGILLSFLADELFLIQAQTPQQTFAAIFATVLFILFSATLMGTGAGLIMHWIMGFVSDVKAFAMEAFLSIAIFFVGIGATIMSGHWMTGLQVFFTFFTASFTMFFFSFFHLFDGMIEGITKIANKYTKKARKWMKKRK